MIKGIMFARLHTSISREEEMILFHARKNVLVDCGGNIWEKISNPDFVCEYGQYGRR